MAGNGSISGDAEAALDRIDERRGGALGGSPGLAASAAVLEDTYERWRTAPESVDPVWRGFFEGFELGRQRAAGRVRGGTSTGAPPAPGVGVAEEARTGGAARDAAEEYARKQGLIFPAIFAYRMIGHYMANLDPLGFNRTHIPELELEALGFEEADLDTEFDSVSLAGGGRRTLREILAILRETYADNIGVEFMHIQDFTMRRWLRDRMEARRNNPDFSTAKKRRILGRLLEAEQFENFLHTRYVGKKRFSLEGGETLIPALDAVIEACPGLGIERIVMGMAHRGRLNVMANILGKDHASLFAEFHDNYIPQGLPGDGDVKYHLGYEAEVATSSGRVVAVGLAPNPSHLEAVDPVVQGKARAWQRRLDDMQARSRVLPLLVHGDAAFIGQGVVAETLNLSRLEGYRTGGTLHVIVNNQIGFTTMPQDGRSTHYCTALAEMLHVPIFHVNTDDPLTVVYAIELALEFRQTFHRDAVVDLVCYRRLGHNEGDEPSFTQPTLYTAIKTHPSNSEILLEQLVAAGEVAEEEVRAAALEYRGCLEKALAAAQAESARWVPKIRPPLACPQLLEPVDTSVPVEVVREVGRAITRVPEEHTVNPKLARMMEGRRRMAEGEAPVDWAFGEALAFGTLLKQGVPIRVSGQDSRRGTFSQRHAVLYDIETRERYIPLNHVSEGQARFCIYNSPLSEAAVLGFDFGYSLDYPEMLTIWEAQFGDFCNNAQVILDQYVAASEAKWGVASGIVLLLPHGYDGQGPEHSSGRLERFLMACAEDNMQVVNCTTPAQYAHVLRRQALRRVRKPLVVFTPKSLLRDPRCVSTLEDVASGPFREILDDPAAPLEARRLVLCSGKVYYDLEAERGRSGQRDTAILRVEQLYPLHERMLYEVASRYGQCERIVWCQEESQNHGAWFLIEPRLRKLFGREILYAGRDASASPATGSAAIHELEQRALVEQAFSV